MKFFATGKRFAATFILLLFATIVIGLGIFAVFKDRNTLPAGGGNAGQSEALSGSASSLYMESAASSYAASEFSSNSSASLPRPTYLEGILIVNKTYSIAPDFATALDPQLVTAFHEMNKELAGSGLSLTIQSGFRSNETQKIIHESYKAKNGKESAELYSARPGHSEHETGLAIDVTSSVSSKPTGTAFSATEEYAWLMENAHRFGFIIRYPEGKENWTGYHFEPWHLRYVGVEFATKLYNQNKCIEEYFRIESKYKDEG